MKREDMMWFCLECRLSKEQKSHLEDHVEAKHIEHDGYICEVCHHAFRSRKTLRNHRNKKGHFKTTIIDPLVVYQ